MWFFIFGVWYSDVSEALFSSFQHTFFQQHNCNTNDANQKYNSRAAQLYREKLHNAAIQAMKTHGTKVSKENFLNSEMSHLYSQSILLHLKRYFLIICLTSIEFCVAEVKWQFFNFFFI